MLYDLNDIIEANDFKIKARKLVEQRKQVELTVKQKKRSIPLNSFLHVVITLFAINFGYTLEEAKTLLKRMCEFMIYEKKGQKFLKRTRDLNNTECSTFVEWIRNYSANQGYYIPDADEYKKNNFAIDKEISKHKQYL